MKPNNLSLQENIKDLWNNSEYFRTHSGEILSPKQVGIMLAPQIAEEIEVNINQLNDSELLKQPIVAVCGLMNSGKSTFVAHQLSEDGRKRILIGDTNATATHRFVFWLPTSWKQFETVFKERLKDVFGFSPELLADVTEDAHKAYNANSTEVEALFNTPIFAYDSKLDELKLAVLDCPDIQRSQSPQNREKTAHLRGEMLRKASVLCSAFVLVSSQEQQETESLQRVVDNIVGCASNLPIFYVLTKTASAEQIYFDEAENRLKQLGIDKKVDSVFVSPRIFTAKSSGFIEQINYLSRNGQHVETNELFIKLDGDYLYRLYTDKIVHNINELLFKLHNATINHVNNNEKIKNEINKNIISIINSGFIDYSDAGNPMLKMHLSPEQITRIINLILQKAPLIIKILYKIKRLFTPNEKNINIKNNITINTQNEIDLLTSTYITEDQARAVVIRAHERLKQMDYSLDENKISQLATQFWIENKVYSRTAILSALMIIPAAALLVMPGGALAAVSLPQLLGLATASSGHIIAGGVLGSASVAVCAGAMYKLQQHLTKELGIKQISDYFAFFQDAMGIMRIEQAINGEHELSANYSFLSTYPIFCSETNFEINPVIDVQQAPKGGLLTNNILLTSI